MSKPKLRVGVFAESKNALNCFLDLPNGHCDKPGVEVEIFHLIMTILGLDYEFVDVEQKYDISKDYGSENNGTWSGMIGLLINGSIDLTALTIRLTPERAEVVDFSFPVRFYETIYIIKTPQELDFRNFIFSSFTKEVWVYFVLCVGAAYAVHFVCVLLLLPQTHSWSYRVEYAFQMMMNERQRYWCCSLLTKIYVFATLVMSEYYRITDLLEEDKCHLTYYIDVPPPCASNSSCERMKDVLIRNPIRLPKTQELLMNDILYDGGIYFGSEDIDLLPNVVGHYDKNLTIIRDTSISMNYVSFAFSKRHKRLRQRFTNALVKVLPGVSEIKTRPYYGSRINPDVGSIRAQMTLTFEQHLRQLFEWWAIAMGGVLIFFVIELFLFYHTQLATMQGTINCWRLHLWVVTGRRLVLLLRPSKKESASGRQHEPVDEGWAPDETNNQIAQQTTHHRSMRIDDANMLFFTYPPALLLPLHERRLLDDRPLVNQRYLLLDVDC